MTFSIVGRTADAAMFGIAIASSSPAVAARCAHARAGVGVVATQNITDPALGPAILDLLAARMDAGPALDRALGRTPHGAYRQLLALGAKGPPAVHSGARALGIVAVSVGAQAAAAGNLLASAAIPGRMVGAFDAGAQSADTGVGRFAARLLDALDAALRLGGEAGPVHSAGLLIVREVAWPIVDLRVDWAEHDPIAALRSLWRLYEPQVEDYVKRAVDPGQAPTFGVPGDS